jgi:hypothetical protein
MLFPFVDVICLTVVRINIDAILKAYEAEAKRAERNAKVYRGDPLEQYWLAHACQVRQYKQEATNNQGEQQ